MLKMRTVEPIRDTQTIDEMKQALLYYGGTRDRFLFTLGINTGLRVSDLLNLKKKNIKDYRLKLTERKTRKYNNLSLLHIQKQIDEYIQFLDDEDYLFQSKKSNEPISRVQAYRILNNSAKAIGLSDIGTHSMRKTFGYWYYKRSNDIALLMTLFNHSSQRVTLEYIGINQDVLDKSFSDSFGGL